MTKEEKELLLKDLCARLQYGVKAKSPTSHLEINTIDGYFVDGDGTKMFHLSEPDFWQEVEYFQYYLRPLSSMTEEEKNEYRMFIDYSYNDFTSESFPCVYVDKIDDYLDWLDSHHFDHRGLIEKGLVLEALEGMYSTTKSITIENIKYGTNKIVKDAKRVVMSPEEMKEMEDVMYNEHGWKNIGNGLKMDRHGNIAGGLKIQ